jgi:hypothetical protein
MKLLPLEEVVLDKLLAGDHPIMSSLRKQKNQAKVKERDFSGAGFFVHLSVDEDLALPGRPQLVIGDVSGVIPGLQYGACFMIFIEGGLLSMLEGASYGEDWPTSISDFKIQYIVNDQPSEVRDMKKLEELLNK